MARRRTAFLAVVIISCAVVLFFGGASRSAGSSAPAATPPPPQSLTLYTIKDAYVAEAAPSTNYGTNGALRVGREAGSDYRSLIQFDLSSMPAGAVVTSAELTLERIINLTSQSQAAIRMQTLAQSVWAQANISSWGEYTVNWDSAPGLTYLGDPAAVVNGELAVSWDVTNIVDEWTSGARVNHGLTLVGDGTSELVSLVSREFGGGPDPELVINYTVAPPTPTVTPTATMAPAEISLEKALMEPVGGVAQVGDQVEFRLIIDNIGLVEIATLPLVDSFDPECYAYDTAYPAPDSVDEGQLIWYDLGPLGPGEGEQPLVRFDTVGACDPAINTAGVSSAVDALGRPVPPQIDTAEITIVPGTPTPTATPYPLVEGSCPGEVTIWASKDTWIDEVLPQDNHGASRNLQVSRESGGLQYPLLYFPIEDAAIPGDMNIYSADLMLHLSGYEQPLDKPQLILRRLTAAWDEATVTWANYWDLGVISDSFSGKRQPMSEQVHTWSLTDQLRRWHSGEQENHGLAIEGSSDMAVWYWSREDVREHHPRLVLSCGYETPTPTPTRTPTRTRTPTPTVTPTHVALDYVLEEMEITQGISKENENPTLVAGKPTFIRVWGRALVDGAHSDASGANAHLSARTVSGTPLEPALLGQISSPGHLTAERWLREDRESSWWFELPYDWRQGNVVVTATIMGAFEDEADKGNNTRIEVFEFRETPPICAVYCRVRTDWATSPQWYMSDTQEGRDMVRRAESLLPVEDIITYVQGGVIEKLSVVLGFIPTGGYEGYDPEDDGWMINHTLWWRDRLSDDPDECDDVGARTHFIGMLMPDGHGENGLAHVGYDQMWFTLRLGNMQGLTTNGYEINKPWGGANLAHELGHNYWQKHPGCGTEDENPGFDYDECWFSDDNSLAYYGYDPITEAVIKPSADVGDLMSYNNQVWISDFTWQQIWNHMQDNARQAMSRLATEPEVGAANLSDQLLVVTGRMPPGSDITQFSRIKILERGIIPTKKEAEITLGPLDQSGPYTIRQLERSHRELSSHNFHATLIQNQDDKYGMFAFAVPYAPNARIFEIWQGDVLLTSATATDISPTVTLLSPNGGEEVGESMTISWKVQDPDSEYLHADVQYSADNGRSWQLLAGDVVSDTVTVATESISGSEGLGLIRVVASDGINTSTDQSSRGFSVEKHAPRPRINSPADGDLYLTGSTIVLRGQAWDAEDGYLKGRALSWTQGGHGQLGTGKEVFVGPLPAGEHTFTLTATDSDRQTGSDTIHVEVRVPELLYLPLLTSR